jgi:hypothetical protein
MEMEIVIDTSTIRFDYGILKDLLGDYGFGDMLQAYPFSLHKYYVVVPDGDETADDTLKLIGMLVVKGYKVEVQ